MNELEIKITKHKSDVIQKYTSGLFKNATLEFFGINTAKIKELINVELPVVEVGESSADFVFLLEDDKYLHFEFQNGFSKNDLIRFAGYDIRLYARDGREIITVVIYSSDVKTADTNLKIGSLTYAPEKIMMSDYDGNAVYSTLEEKLKSEQDLTDADILNLILLPLMRNNIPKDELAKKSIKLANTIQNRNKRDTCTASVFAFSSNYLTNTQIDELQREVSKVNAFTDMMTRIVMDEIADDRVKIAKKMLAKNKSIEEIAEFTELDIDAIEALQEQLEQEDDDN